MRAPTSRGAGPVGHASRPSPAANDGVAMYAKLAVTLRLRIARGDWKLGDQMPTIDALAQEMGVGKVTVRQAYAMLAADGLIESRRGRGTHVSSVPPARAEALRSVINSDTVDAAQLQIQVLSVERGVSLPASLQPPAGTSARYVRISKLHRYRGTPFGYFEMFVRQTVFDRFPKGAIEHSKVNWLIRQAVPREVDTLRQRITFEPAAAEVARMLYGEDTALLAVVRRWLIAKNGDVLSAGDFYYRGDQFVMESEMPASLSEAYPSLSNPARRR